MRCLPLPGVNVEQGIAIEGYVPIGKNGNALLGLGGDYKHTFNTNNPNDDHHEKNGYLIIPIEVISARKLLPIPVLPVIIMFSLRLIKSQSAKRKT